MTETEIIKTLENLLEQGNTPINNCFLVLIGKQTIKETLDLINSKNEYIKKCDNLERIADKTIASQKAEIERLQIVNKGTELIIDNLVKRNGR